MDRLRKENAHLRRKVDEVSKRVAKPPDSDKSKLLEVSNLNPLDPITKCVTSFSKPHNAIGTLSFSLCSHKMLNTKRHCASVIVIQLWHATQNGL